jgi:outer membrane immunogenic protein
MIVSCAALATMVVAASAADLPSAKGPPVYVPPPPPVFSWTGFYVGAQVGYEWGDTSGALTRPPGRIAINRPFSQNPDGVVGGIHLGYDEQFSQFVVGLEGDVNGSGYQGSSSIAPGNPVFERERTPIDGSLRGRVGVAFDRILLYGTGGVAFGDFATSLVSTPPAPVYTETHYPLRVGWTAGAGIEYAIDNNWSVRAEYRYTDYGNFNVVYTNFLAPPVTVRYRATDNRAQVGFSYKFDFAPPLAPPVVAKY